MSGLHVKGSGRVALGGRHGLSIVNRLLRDATWEHLPHQIHNQINDAIWPEMDSITELILDELKERNYEETHR